MSNFSQRLITGAIYVALIFFSLIAHPLAFGILTVVFNFIAVSELLKMSSKNKIKKAILFVTASSILLLFTVITVHLKLNNEFIIYAILILVILYMLDALFQKEGNPADILSVNLLGLVYITVPLILINLLTATSNNLQIPYVLLMFVIIWTNDTFAYLFGIAFGKHKIFERISPKKSWEGFFGGLLMVTVASFIINYFYPSAGFYIWLSFGLITAIAAVLGDFIESMFKRTYGVKDSGSILPGHGGILDRIDSLLFASPALFIFLNFILKQGV